MMGRGEVAKIAAIIPLVGALIALLAFVILTLRGPSQLHFELANDNDEQGQIYVDIGKGYVGEKVVSLTLAPDGKLHKYALDIRNSLPKAIRLDPGSGTGNVQLKRVRFESGLYVRNVPCSELRLLHGLEHAGGNPEECQLRAVSDDPYVDFPIALTLMNGNIKIKWGKIFEGLSFAVITFFLLQRASVPQSRSPRMASEWLFNSRCLRLYALLALGFLSFLYLNLHVSSIGEWRNFVSPDAHNDILLGKSRAIRSDEWLVQTPFYASQVAAGYSVHNPSLGADGVPLTATVPVQGIYGYSQPRFWGFYFLGFEKGFSWLYAWRIFGLLLSTFVLCSILTKGNFWLSLTGAVWIVLSPFTQWWFTTNLPDMMIGFAAGIAALYILISTKNMLAASAAAIVLFFAGITFVTALYPAFLIPLFYLAIFIFIGLVFRDRLQHRFLSSWRIKVFFLAVSVSAILWILVDWLKAGSLPISLLRNSVYPGKRISLGGDLPLAWLFSGYFSPFYGADTFPRAMENVSHGSNFLLMFPVAWFVMGVQHYRKRFIDPLDVAISSYIIFILVWITLGFPDWLAVGSGMSMSPPIRSLLGIGLASILLIVSVGSTKSDKNTIEKTRGDDISALWLGFGVLASSAGIAFWLGKEYPDFVTPGRAVVVISLLTLWGLAFISGAHRWLAGLTFLMVFHGLAANPLAYGITPLRNAELTAVLQEDASSSSTKWLAFSNLLIPQFLKAHGATVWNGVRFISDPAEMRILDPTESYRNVWYRYAHFIVEAASPSSKATFELKNTDVVLLNVDACSDDVRALGINRFAFMAKPKMEYSRCIVPLRPGPVAGLWLYKRLESNTNLDVMDSLEK